MWLLGFALFFVGIATSITFVSTVTGSVSVAPEAQKGGATGIIFTTAWMGCALGVSLMGFILAMGSKDYVLTHVSQLALSPSQLSAVDRVAKGISPYDILAKIPSAIDLAQTAFLEGFHLSMWIWFGLSIFGIFLTLFLKRLPTYH